MHPVHVSELNGVFYLVAVENAADKSLQFYNAFDVLAQHFLHFGI